MKLQHCYERKIPEYIILNLKVLNKLFIHKALLMHKIDCGKWKNRGDLLVED